MGRAKQPINLLVAKGKKNLTKAEIAKRQEEEIRGNIDNIVPPDYLPPSLKQEFVKIADELMKLDIIANTDCDALARYIVSEFNYQKVTKKLLKTSVDNEKYFNYLMMQEKLFKQSRAAATDLGLTISSRCKLVVPKPKEKEKENKFSKFM